MFQVIEIIFIEFSYKNIIIKNSLKNITIIATLISPVILRESNVPVASLLRILIV